jgi:glutathione synthase/RimK-type ligase-like ATP-grasp enzyme
MNPSEKQPRVLIVSFQNFIGIAHLPRYLAEAGFQVAALCPGEGYLSQTRFLNQIYYIPKHFLYWNIREQFLGAVGHWNPELVIPGDDTAFAFLQNLFLQLPENDFPELSKLLRHSLGSPEYYRSCSDKALFGKMAQELGLLVPEQYLCSNPAEVLANGSRLGYPVVFKKTLSCGGIGVEICKNEEELRKHTKGFFGNGVMRFTDYLRWEVHKARGFDLRHLMQPQEESILLQSYIPGPVLSHTFAIWKGDYLSGFTYENLNHAEVSKHPCRQLRILDAQYDCEEIARKLSGVLKLSGFACIDFIRAESGELYILECNARPTHTVILGKSIGLDLCQLLFDQRTLSTEYVSKRMFTLFPDALRENRAVFDATSSIIPWDDAALLTSFLTEIPPVALTKKWLVRMAIAWLKDKWKGYQNRHLKFRDPAEYKIPKEEALAI